MRDLKSAKLMALKAALLLALGILSAVMLFSQAPSWKVVVLLVVTVWAFCRAYYFAFYVIERYVDSRYRFSGLLSFLRYLFRRKKDV